MPCDREQIFTATMNFALDIWFCRLKPTKIWKTALTISIVYSILSVIANFKTYFSLEAGAVVTDNLIQNFILMNIIAWNLLIIVPPKKTNATDRLVKDALTSAYEYGNSLQREFYFNRQQYESGRKKIKLKFSIICLFITFAIIVNSLLPLLLFLLIGRKREEERETLFIIQFFYPYDVNKTTFGFVTANLINTIVTSITMFGVTMFQGFYYFLNEIGRSEMAALIRVIDRTDDIVRLRTGHLKPDVRKYVGRTKRRLYQLHYANWLKAQDDVYRSLIVACCHHHRSIHAYSVTLIRTMKYPVLFICLQQFFILTAYFYLSIKNGINGGALAMMFVCIANAVIYLFWNCRAGEFYLTINERFKDGLYGTEWYAKSEPIQKMILSWIILTDHRLSLSGSPEVYLSLVLFKLIAKQTYNSVSFLLSLKK